MALYVYSTWWQYKELLHNNRNDRTIIVRKKRLACFTHTAQVPSEQLLLFLVDDGEGFVEIGHHVPVPVDLLLPGTPWPCLIRRIQPLLMGGSDRVIIIVSNSFVNQLVFSSK